MAFSRPLISVVIPSYNYARFLPDCIASVTSQDYPNLELVVFDDRSKDTSVEVLHQIASDPATKRAFNGRIHVEVNERNLGAHETINRAIAHSAGEYVCILNADDTFGPGRLKRMHDAMSVADAKFAFSKVDFIDEEGARSRDPDPIARKLERRQWAIKSFPTVGFACVASNVAISTGNFLFTRRLFDEIGPFSDLRYCHDWDFLLRVLLRCEPLYVADAIYNYRIHGSNSFRSLDGVAASESATVYRSYFDKVAAGIPTNRQAPDPRYWPGVFDVFMSAYGLWSFWSADRPN